MIVGVDEVGRGPLAGPVVAAAVIFTKGNIPIGINDSKKLSAKKREQLSKEIILTARKYCIASASVEEIDNINILQASLLAMRRAVDGLNINPTMVYVDGNKLPDWNYTSEAIIKGDSKVIEIAAASIIAKVYRDNLLVEYDKKHPEYGFAQHKGYPTKVHLESVRKFGVLDIHRKSFKPIRELLI
ncbi:MAG: ribonuclease HII [Francisellaceae bacterium]|jgi:ribonuclease HII